MKLTEKQDEYVFILNLIMLREMKEWKQWQMVEKLGHGLNMKRYQSWEERRAFPSIFFVRKIAELFAYDIKVLLTERIKEEAT